MEKASPITWRSRLHNTIYESNTVAGKVFDVALLILIISSIVVVMLDSISSYHNQYGRFFILWNGFSQACLHWSTCCV